MCLGSKGVPIKLLTAQVLPYVVYYVATWTLWVPNFLIRYTGRMPTKQVLVLNAQKLRRASLKSVATACILHGEQDLGRSTGNLQLNARVQSRQHFVCTTHTFLGATPLWSGPPSKSPCCSPDFGCQWVGKL